MEKDIHIPQKYQNRIVKDIQYCEGCQPRDNEEIDGLIWIFGDRISFWDYLEKIGLPEKYFNQVDEYYNCPNCGSPIWLTSDVGLESKYEIEIEKKFQKILNKVVPNIEYFKIFIEKYPYLGPMHIVGKRIEKEIESLKIISIENEIWYRARNICDGKVLKKRDMEPPDPKTVPISEGRFNHYGQSHLYLGSTKIVCIEEINRNIEAICWMQDINIIKADKIIDLSEYITSNSINEVPATFCGVMYNGTITNEVKKDSNWKPEYFISRYISDIAKKHGFNGIKYNSSISYGENLVIFDINGIKMEYLHEPEIFMNKKEMSLF